MEEIGEQRGCVELETTPQQANMSGRVDDTDGEIPKNGAIASVNRVKGQPHRHG